MKVKTHSQRNREREKERNLLAYVHMWWVTIVLSLSCPLSFSMSILFTTMSRVGQFSLSLCPSVFRANRSEHAFLSLGLMIILRNISQMMLRRKNMIHSRWRGRRQREDSHAERIMSSNSIDNETSEAADESASKNGVTSISFSLSLFLSRWRRQDTNT